MAKFTRGGEYLFAPKNGTAEKRALEIVDEIQAALKPPTDDNIWTLPRRQPKRRQPITNRKDLARFDTWVAGLRNQGKTVEIVTVPYELTNADRCHQRAVLTINGKRVRVYSQGGTFNWRRA